MTRSEAAGLGPFAAWAALALLALAATAGVDYLPTHDGPQHVYSLHVASRLGAPASASADAGGGEPTWGGWLEPAWPVTNHGFALFFAPLDALLDWRPALRIALGAMVLVWAGGAFAFVRAVHPGRAWVGVALAAAALQWSLWMGLFSFYAATGVGLWIWALAFRTSRTSPTRTATPSQRALLAVLLLAQAAMHVVPAVLTGILVAALALARAAPGRRGREIVATALTGAPAALLALTLLGVGLQTLGDLNEGQQGAGTTGPAGLWILGRAFTSGPAWRAWPLTLLAASAPIAWVLTRRAGVRTEDRVLLAYGAVGLAAAAALPLHIRAWDFFSVRFIPLATCALVAALPFERLPGGWPQRIAAAALASFAGAATLWAVDYDRALADAARPALAGLDVPLRRDGPRLPIVLDPYLGRPLDDRSAPVPYAVPLLNLGQLYALEQGGVTPYGFTGNPYLHAAVLRQDLRMPRPPDRKYAAELARPVHAGDLDLRRAITNYVAAHGADHADVIVWGRPDDVDHLLSLGFEADYRKGGLAIARFRGCPLTIAFPPDSGLEGHHVVEVGWAPAWHVTHRFALGGARWKIDGSVEVPVRQTPCSGAWLRLSAEGLRCEGADAEGRILVPSPAATPRVECRVLTPAGDLAHAD